MQIKFYLKKKKENILRNPTSFLITENESPIYFTFYRKQSRMKTESWTVGLRPQGEVQSPPNRCWAWDQ